MKIYFDACCLNRPFDALYKGQARLEAEAISILLEQCESGNFEMVSGDFLRFELSLISDVVKRNATLELESLHHHFIALDDSIIERGKDLEKESIAQADALHLATAEKAGVDFFLSTDYKLLKKASDIGFSFKVMNPLNLAIRELGYE